MSEELTQQMPAHIQAAQEDQRGKQELDDADKKIPRINLLHEDSAGNKEGEFVHSVSNQSYGREFDLLVVDSWYEYFKWDEDSLDFRTKDPKDERILEIKGLEWIDDKPPIVTKYIQVLVLNLVDNQPMMMSFSKSSMKAGVELLNIIKITKGPAWARKYKLSSIGPIEGKMKKTYYKMKVSPGSWPSEEQFAIADGFYKMAEELKSRTSNTDAEF